MSLKSRSGSRDFKWKLRDKLFHEVHLTGEGDFYYYFFIFSFPPIQTWLMECGTTLVFCEWV